jgi:hypothetical protein
MAGHILISLFCASLTYFGAAEQRLLYAPKFFGAPP